MDFFYSPNSHQQRAGRHNGYATNYPPRSYHRDPPSSTDMSQGASSGGHEGTRQIKNDPDTEQNFGGFPATFGSNATGPAFTSQDGGNHLYPSQMFSQHHGGNLYGQELKMDGMTQALDDQANYMMEHPSPGSEVYSWDDIEGLPSLHNEHPQSHGSLPSHEQTESYLRQNLSIYPPQPVNLDALADEPFGTRLPKITELIKLAIWGSQSKKLTLRQIYDAIETRYPSWKTASDKPWQRSIRHNLSLKAIFVRVERPVNHPGKGCYWALDVRQGEGNKRDRKRKDPVGGSRSSASDDSDEDERNPTRGQGGPYMSPQNLFHPSGPANAMAIPPGYMPPPPVHHYSDQTNPNARWSPAASAPHLQHFTQPMMASPSMQMSRANTYPIAMGLPPQVEHYSQMRGGGPMMAGHGYPGPFPPMPARQGNPYGYNAPPPRARRPHSDISPEQDTEETGRSSRRHRAQ